MNKHSLYNTMLAQVRTRLLVIAVYCLLLTACSCKKNIIADAHPDFIHTISKKAATAQPGNTDAAIYFIDSVFKILLSPGPEDIFIKDSIIASMYQTKREFITSLSYLDNMIALAKERTADEKYAERYARSLYLKGQTLNAVERFNEATHFISLAEDAVLRFVKNKCNLSDYSGWKANLMYSQKKFCSSAVYYAKQSRYLQSVCDANSFNFLNALEGSLTNAAVSYFLCGMPDSSSFYLDKASQILVKMQTLHLVTDENIRYYNAFVYASQADLLVLKRQYAQAADLYKKSIAGSIKLDTFFAQSGYAELANLYLKQNNYDAAWQALVALNSSLAQSNHDEARIRLYNLSWKYYAARRSFKEAFKLQQLYEQLRDSIEEKHKKFVSKDLGKEFENLELEYSNEVLLKESKLKTIYIGFAVGIFAVITAIAFFTWYNLKNTRVLHQHLKQQNDEMEIAFASLEKSHQENNRIIRIIAHDLKNPVSTINYLAFSLLRKNPPEDLKEIFELIKKASSSSMVLINDALMQKKNSSVVRKELVDMKRLLEYCVNLLQAKATEKNQLLHLQAEDVSMMLNRQKIWRVISNIVTNAIKFSPEDTIIDIKLQRKETSILLSVHDKGIGIPENLKDKIFTLSPEASRQGTFGEPSYGLGLSISQQIVKEHNGKIWFDSVDGKGSVFYIELPSAN